MAIREFRGTDFETIARLLGSTWHSQHGKRAYWYGADELCDHLCHADHGFVALNEVDEVIAAVLVKAPGTRYQNGEMRGHWLKQRALYGMTARMLGMDLRADASVLADENALMEEVAAQQGDECVGSIALLIVSETERGRGVGKILLSRGIDWLAEHGAHAVRLVTDSDCDWQLYEHLGMTRVAETTASEYPSLKIFVYQVDLAQLMCRI